MRVPTLGGYLLNKALTFMERLAVPTGGTSKAAKDLVYIRDVMAGGESVRKQVRQDMLLITKSKTHRDLPPTALNRLLRVKSSLSTVLEEAATQLAAHHGLESTEAAKADLVGYLDTYCDLLDEMRRERQEGRRKRR